MNANSGIKASPQKGSGQDFDPSTAKIAIIASEHEDAQKALIPLLANHETVPIEEADVIVAMGGDGFMLQTLHANMGRNIPIYGLNRGTVGFLLNPYNQDVDLRARIRAAQMHVVHPLRMTVVTQTSHCFQHLAVNEVSLLRETRQTAVLEIAVNGVTRLEELVGDGVLVSTPAGSTAYNFSAGGPILPIGANMIALTPLSPFRPRRWKGALLPHDSEVRMVVKQPRKRPVSAVADMHEVRDVKEVTVREAREISLYMLFDPDHSLDDRVLTEQFV